MNFNKVISVLFILAFAVAGFAQSSPVGIWVTQDDETGEKKSKVEIYEQDGKLYGKISELLLKGPDTVCAACKGDKHNQLVLGMVIIEGMKADGDTWSSGTILDPNSGKVYKCKFTMEDTNTLKVRGYIGFEALGRNQVWTRA